MHRFRPTKGLRRSLLGALRFLAAREEFENVVARGVANLQHLGLWWVDVG